MRSQSPGSSAEKTGTRRCRAFSSSAANTARFSTRRSTSSGATLRCWKKMMSLLLPQVHGRAVPPPDVSKRLAEALLPQAEEGLRKNEQPDQVEVDTTLAFSTLERLQHLDFEAMSGEEWRAAKSLIEKMHLPIRTVTTRRYKPDPRGTRLDLADTLR